MITTAMQWFFCKTDVCCATDPLKQSNPILFFLQTLEYGKKLKEITSDMLISIKSWAQTLRQEVSNLDSGT